MSLQEKEPLDEVQPFGVTLIAALTAIIPLVILLRGEPRSLSVLAALFGVTAGVGLFFQKTWGRWLTILYYAITVVLLLVQGITLPMVWLSCVLPVAIIGYLCLPRITLRFQNK